MSVRSVPLTVCYSLVKLILKETGEGKASDFLSTLFLWFACHKVNHSKPVIQFPVSWSRKEYIFNLPVQHMFSGEGDFGHRDDFRAASKRTVCGRLTSERRNIRDWRSSSGRTKHVAYYSLTCPSVGRKSSRVVSLHFEKKQLLYTYVRCLLRRPFHPDHPIFCVTVLSVPCGKSRITSQPLTWSADLNDGWQPLYGKTPPPVCSGKEAGINLTHYRKALIRSTEEPTEIETSRRV